MTYRTKAVSRRRRTRASRSYIVYSGRCVEVFVGGIPLENVTHIEIGKEFGTHTIDVPPIQCEFTLVWPEKEWAR